MEDRTPAEWLPILTKKMDAAAPRLNRLRNYATGLSDLPEMNAATKENWLKFQAKSRTGMPQLVISSASDRMNPVGALLNPAPNETETEKAARLAAEAYIRKAWKENNIGIVLADAVWDSLAVSISYLMVARDSVNEPVLTFEKFEFMYAEPDPLKPWISVAAVKVWRGDDGNDYAYVWVPNLRQRFKRPSKMRNGRIMMKASGGWELDGEPTVSPKRPPIYIMRNRNGKGEFEEHIGTIDRIHLGILNRIVTTVMQAYRQRALSGDLPDEDEEGNPIDWAGALVPGPGSMWRLPADSEIWESAATDITPHLTAVKDDIRQLSADTSTPVTTLLPDSANQSATGALTTTEAQYFKVLDRTARMSPPAAAAILDLVRMVSPGYAGSLEVEWMQANLSTPAERSQAAVSAKAAGVPFRTIMHDIFGYSHEKIDGMLLEQAEEQLQLSILMNPAPAPTPAVQVATTQAPAAVDDPAAVKAKADAMGILIRAGVVAESAAQMVGFNAVEFSGAMPTSLRLPAADASKLEA